MPEVFVYAIEGRSIEQKRSLVKKITDAVVEDYKVGPDAVSVILIDTPKSMRAKAGVLLSDKS
ncbi:MAG: tautomerase family protein [Rhodospirillales bacterium]|nr:tautomerase family protein [Rhodospirillales bacterium]